VWLRTKLPPIAGTLKPLQFAPFGRLLFSYFLNYTGDLIGLVALSILVFDETGSALATSTLFIAKEFLPALLAPWLTARLDRYSARSSLSGVYLIEGAIFSALALTADHFSLAVILVLALADGVLSLTARGLTRAAVNSTLTPHSQLRQGNAILNVAFAISLAGGAALGGVLVGAAGIPGALIADAASFVVVGVVLGSAARMPATSVSPASYLSHVREGLARVRDDARTRLLVAGESVAVFFFALIVPIEVVYATKTLQTDSLGYGVFLSSWGVGCVLGSLAFIRLKRGPLPRLILVSTTAIGLAYVGIAGVHQLLVACLFSILGGFGNGIQWVAVMTALQESTPANLQARVTGLLESATSLTTGVGFLLGGLIVTLASPPAAYAISGGGVLVLVVLGTALRLTRRARRSSLESTLQVPAASITPREPAGSMSSNGQEQT
jgi:MFS family permease